MKPKKWTVNVLILFLIGIGLVLHYKGVWGHTMHLWIVTVAALLGLFRMEIYKLLKR